MGKATRWLKGLFGKKKEKEHVENSSPLALDKERKRWSFTRSCKEVTHIRSTLDNDLFRYCFAEKENEQNKNGIAVAAADATVAAAQAAVTVVRARSHGSDTLFSGGVNWWAALKIQSFFRGYLARKALRALKGLVKIQALVRGYLVRKRAAATLYSMQALMRAQVAITSQRAHCYTSMERLQPEIRAKIYTQRYDGIRSEFQSKRLARSCDTSLNGFDESPKSVEIDNHVPHQLRPSRYTTTAMSECGKEFCSPCRAPRRKSVPECRPRQDCELYFDEECKFSTASSTPRLANYCKLHNAPPTPVKSVCGETLLSSCPDSPNYMANTQSSMAKLRSHSAPRQRPDHKKRFSVSETMAARNSTTGVRMQSSPQTVEYSILNKIVQEYYVNWEGQSKI